ncbi:MAG TPA: hypothetical protein VFK14_10105 [Solirubrobacterales bacterium]|nr:hypothetical protein [Solirubrobacterales bacterium]
MDAAESPGSSTSPSSSDTPKLAEAGISEETIRRGISRKDLDPHDHEALKGIDHWQDILLKKSYATALLRLVTAQLLVADGVFIAYAWAGKDWQLEPGVIQVWLAATLIELIGVALVITQYLFPRRDR